MPFSAVASASPSLSSAVAFAYLNCVCAAVLCCVARCCRWCRRHAVALIGLCRYSHCSCACHRSAWRATRCFPWCRRLAVALISCCRSSTHSLAVRCSAQRAAYCSRCRCRLCRPCLSRRPRRCFHRLSPLLNSTHSLAFSRSSWFAARSLAAVVGYAIVSCRIVLAIALIGCRYCLHHSLVCRSSALRTTRCSRCCPLLAFALIFCSRLLASLACVLPLAWRAARRFYCSRRLCRHRLSRRPKLAVALIGCRSCSPRSLVCRRSAWQAASCSRCYYPL